MSNNDKSLLGALAGVALILAAPAASAFDFTVEGAKTATATLQVAGRDLTASFAQAAVEHRDQLGRYCLDLSFAITPCLKVIGFANGFTTRKQYDDLAVGQILWLPLPEVAVAYQALHSTQTATAATVTPSLTIADLSAWAEKLGLLNIKADMAELVAAEVGKYVTRLGQIEGDLAKLEGAVFEADGVTLRLATRDDVADLVSKDDLDQRNYLTQSDVEDFVRWGELFFVAILLLMLYGGFRLFRNKPWRRLSGSSWLARRQAKASKSAPATTATASAGSVSLVNLVDPISPKGWDWDRENLIGAALAATIQVASRDNPVTLRFMRSVDGAVLPVKIWLSADGQVQTDLLRQSGATKTLHCGAKKLGKVLTDAIEEGRFNPDLLQLELMPYSNVVLLRPAAA